MNNSIRKKINPNYKNNLGNTELSSTSSEFMTKFNYNIKTIKQKGGNCSCKYLFKSIGNKNFELILYILKENNCCFMCNDSDGNTGMHLLIPFYKENKQIANIIDNILSDDCCDFINIQNNKGQTPMLVAVMNDLDELAEKMENCGADPSIQDNEGNFISEKTNKKNDIILESDLDESVIKKNVMNIINVVVSKQPEHDLTSLNLNDNNESSNISNNFADTDNFMEFVKSKINSSIGKKNKSDDSSSSSSEFETFPKLGLGEKLSSDTLNTEKFISLLDRDNKPMGTISYPSNSEDDNTERFIATLRHKYDAISETDKLSKPVKINNHSKLISNSDTLAGILSSDDKASLNKNMIYDTITSTGPIEKISKQKIDKLINETTSDELLEKKDTISSKKNQIESETSSNVFDSNLGNTDIKKIINETTSDESIGISNSKSKYSIFLKDKLSSNDISNSTEIDTNTLLKVIKKIQTNNIIESEKMLGGGNANKKQIMIGHRILISDSDKINSKKNLKLHKSTLVSDDYNALYNSDSELGTKSKVNELSRMMISQKEKIHNEVLETIMGMLNNGLLTQSNKPIEANEKNAKLIKAFIYRQISEKNPQMGGMDKILAFKTMSENEIINMVKKMPNLDELEKSIQKHIEEKSAKKNNKKSIDVSETSETSETDKPKKSSKKASKK